MVENEKRKNKALLNADSSYANAVGDRALNDIISTMLRPPGGFQIYQTNKYQIFMVFII